MIKEYLDYKRRKVDEVINSPLVSPQEKQKVIDEYNQFIGEAFNEQYPGRIILSKKIISELMTLAKEGKIPLVLNPYDTAIVLGPDMPNANGDKHPFKSVSDLVAVHKTVIPPVKDTILTRENNGDVGEVIFTDPSTGKSHIVTYPSGNDTIHFTLNCPVQNHDVGNDWDSYEYAVMIGLDKLDKTKILDVKSEDTYVDGNAELGDDYILFCPLGQREKMQELNPKAMIIEYDGITLNQAIENMILYSGRKVEEYGTYGWGRNFEYSSANSDNVCLNELMTERDYPVLDGQFGSQLHSESKYMARRMWKREYEAILNLIEYNRENNIDMPVDIMMFLVSTCGAYATPGLLNVSVEQYKEFVLPILEKHGYDVGEELFDGISPSAEGMKYISHFADPRMQGMTMPSVQCPEWENELRSRVISIAMGNKKTNTDGDEPKGSGKK